MVKVRRSVLGLLIVGLSVAGCGSAPPADAPGSVTAVAVGTSPTLSNASLYQADAGGYFVDHGLAPTLSPVQSGAAAVPLLLNGQLQFAAADPMSVIVALSKDVPITIVSGGNVATADPATDSTAILVKGDGPIGGAADLDGRTVAVNALNGLSMVTAQKTIDSAGGDSTTVRFVELPLPQMVDATVRGQVDAAVVNEPFSTQGTEAGLRKVAAPFSAALPGVPQLVYIAASPWAAQNPRVVSGFADSITQANGYLTRHPEDIREIGKRSTQTPPDVLAKIVLPTFPADPLTADDLTPLMDLMVEYRVLQAPVDLRAAMTGPSS